VSAAPDGVREDEEDASAPEPARSRELLGTLLLALAIAFGSRAFLIAPFRIPSGSMLPTLWIGDHLFVNKLVYGARIPLTDWHLPALRAPRRGEVVVFAVAVEGDQTYPADRRRDLPREDFVKRIIGLPGERIDIVDGVVFVNGDPIASQRSGEHFRDEAGRELEVQEIAIGDRHFEVLDDPQLHPYPETFVVEPGRYFMLGDNRDWSKDSREWGTVRRAEIVGPAFRLYWSWGFSGGWLDLLNPVTWLSAGVRWERVGQAIR
jgi:signal peptidase I